MIELADAVEDVAPFLGGLAAEAVGHAGDVGLVEGPDLLARQLSDGLTMGIVLGALVIVAAWLLTLAYVWWANSIYDPALARLRETRDVSSESHAAGSTHT